MGDTVSCPTSNHQEAAYAMPHQPPPAGASGGAYVCTETGTPDTEEKNTSYSYIRYNIHGQPRNVLNIVAAILMCDV